MAPAPAEPFRPLSLVAGDRTVPFAEGVVAVGDVELAVAVSGAGPGVRVDWSVRNPGRSEVRLGEVAIVVEAAPARVLEHGWQSWSAVRRCAPGDVRRSRRRVPAWRRRIFFADPDRAGHAVAGDQFLVTDGGVAGFLDGRRHLCVVEAGPPPSTGLTARVLLDGVALAPGTERRLEPLWLAAGDPGERYSEYAGRWGAEAGARAGTPAVSGWCSWYHYYSSVTPADVRANLALAAGHGLEFVQVDDGYQAAVGEWLATRPSWAEGTAPVARDITAAGLRAGIWTSPFLVDEGSALVRDHPDWVLGRAMHNPVWWGGWALGLDTTNPAVLDHVRSTMAALTAQGFDYHKVDFLYGAAVAVPPGGRHTRAEAVRSGLEAVRQGIGDGAFLLGCGAPFGPAVGVVDAMRVSPDVTPRWAPVATLPGMAEAASCARNAVTTSLLRAPLHRRLWINDGDCLLLRPEQTELEPWRRRLLAAAVAGGGGFTVASDDLGLYGPEEWALLETARSAGRAGDQPLDLVDPFARELRVRSGAFQLTVGPVRTGRRRHHPGGSVVLDTPGGWLAAR